MFHRTLITIIMAMMMTIIIILLIIIIIKIGRTRRKGGRGRRQ